MVCKAIGEYMATGLGFNTFGCSMTEAYVESRLPTVPTSKILLGLHFFGTAGCRRQLHDMYCKCWYHPGSGVFLLLAFRGANGK